ncbi:class I SAM-dependent methyltransferase [Thiohalocapsa marina]|uniref:Class I SAM-dependent methyltransferase n=2 Tax=Thiohalocapsa marina TaxID=424902 RepID=A0A5M8FU15_9GAMM|nr:class I SAM-dependent methyltransferase [Thiohalocapsa marina]
MLFVRLGTTHTSIAPWESEIASLKRYCEERGIAQDRLELIQGFSDEVLPTLPKDELDLVLIDGGHGFPTPIIDWYYAAGRLRNHGVLVIDDVQLPAVQMLLAFLDADPRWTRIETTPKWVAYRRDSEGTLQEGHEKQDFLGESRMWTHSAPRTRIFDRLRLNKKT